MTDQELVKRPFDEEFDTMMEVQRNPTGAWMAIQEQANCIEELEKRCSLYARADRLFVEEINDLEAKLTKAVEALVQLERIVRDILGAHLQDHESRDEAIDLIKTTLAELEGEDD